MIVELKRLDKEDLKKASYGTPSPTLLMEAWEHRE